MVLNWMSCNYTASLLCAGEDISKDGDMGIVKRIKVNGEGYDQPNDGSQVGGKGIMYRWASRQSVN